MQLKYRLVAALCLAVLFGTRAATAAPFDKEFTFTQPNGAKIQIHGWGDEFSADFETADGYAVVFNPKKNAYCYAEQSLDGSIQPGNLVVGSDNPGQLQQHIRATQEARKKQIAQRYDRWNKGMDMSERWTQQKAQMDSGSSSNGFVTLSPPSSTTTGTRQGLCLLIDFDNDPATIPRSDIDAFCNGDSYSGYGNNGSVKQYFQDVSNGRLTYTNVVTVYIRIPNSLHPKSYYDDPTKDCGDQANLLIRDAITIMKAIPNYTTEILPTFSNLTVDGSNRVVACNVFYAGGNSNVWSYGLWPHSWSLYNVGPQSLSSNGKQVYRYQITDIGTSLELGTFCHENGHMLCSFPDLYDYDYDSIGGAGKFCLMSYGNFAKNPAQVCAYLKRAAGWATTIDFTANYAGTFALAASGAGFNTFYRCVKPSTATEYFLLENRQQTGRDAGIPASGVAIWHVDELGDRDNQSLVPNTTHANYELTLVQADNLWHFEHKSNYGDSKDLYYSGNTATGYTNSFSDTTGPNAHWWDGSNSGLILSQFSAVAASMTVRSGSAPVQRTLTVNSGSGSGLYYAGQVISISAQTPAQGFIFDKWIGDTAYVANVTASSTSLTMPDASATVTATYTDSDGTGLFAEYFNEMNLTGFVLSRIDPNINFTWPRGASPDPSVGDDTFSARWSGYVKPRYSETYTFYTYADDGIRLWVNGSLIVNDWSDHSARERSGTITLFGGQKYDFTVEYYDNTLDATAKVSWSSTSQAKEVIPQARLYPKTAVVSSPDLSAAGISLSSPPDDWGQYFDAYYTVANNGNAQAAAFRVGFYLSDNNTYEAGSDILLGSAAISALAAGQSVSNTISLRLPDASPYSRASGVFYILMVVDDQGSVAESDESNNGNSASFEIPSGAGTGLLGEYYNEKDLTSLVLTRVDPVIDFTWPTGSSPDPLIGDDTFSIRWTGKVVPPYTDTYTFTTRADDGIRLWVNGVLLVNDWSDHSARDKSGAIALNAGVEYDIKVEYYENAYDASARLSWACTSIAKQVIPQQYLYPPAASTPHTLTVNSGSGDGTYTPGAVVNIVADAAPAGKVFSAWAGDTASVANVKSASTTVTMPTSNVTLTATYADVYYTLTVNSGSGDGSYAMGTVVAISADVPALGKAFAAWIGDTAGVANTKSATTTVTMPAGNVTLTATYADVYYTLNVNSGSGDGSYVMGTVVTISADAPALGKVFASWAGDTAGVANTKSATTTITMPACNATLTATYADVYYMLAVNSGSGDGSYVMGTVVTISADAPATGMAFDKWTGDTAYVSSVNASSATITMPAAGVSVTAAYKQVVGTGLLGEYYNEKDLTSFVFSRIDPTINFTWPRGTSPDPLIGEETFSIRWTGLVEAPYTGTYTFYTCADDGIRLYVNGVLVVNDWSDHSAREKYGSIALTGGQKYSIKVEYYENLYDASAKLSWAGPNIAKQVVPVERLYPN